MVGWSSDRQELAKEIIKAGGGGLELVVIDDSPPSMEPVAPGVVRVGIHRGKHKPPIDPDLLAKFDILLSSSDGASRPWTVLPSDKREAVVKELEATLKARPVACGVLAAVLRTGEALPMDQALTLESIAYSMLLSSAEFREWQQNQKPRRRRPDHHHRVKLFEQEDKIHMVLARPAARNAFDARMRDELCMALDFILNDPDERFVEMRGEGATFSVGGDLDEFGSAQDVGMAHLIRTLRSPVGLLCQARRRVSAHLHGPCIGAGIEFPAAAGKVLAKANCYFQLPEVSMGLIPGAGGTASIPRRIGRHRTCYMAVTGTKIDVPTALSWGLIDAVEPAS